MATQLQIEKLTNKAVKYCNQRKLAQGRQAAKKLISMDSSNFNGHQILGLINLEEKRFRLAIENFLDAIKFAQEGNNVVKVKLNLGTCYESVEDWELAIKWYQAVLEEDMTNATALMGKGKVLNSLGNFKEALINFKQVIFYPDKSETNHSVARAVAHSNVMQSPLVVPDETDINLLKRDIEQCSSDNVEALINYNFALGAGLERLKFFDEAFAAYSNGNRIKRNNVRYPEAKLLKAGESLFDIFDKEIFLKLKKLSRQQTAPIFVLGLPRSGTTLIESILGAAPGVAEKGELPWIPSLITEMEQKPLKGKSYPDVIYEFDQKLIEKKANQYLQRAGIEPGTIAVDKLPGNFWHIGFIKILFPKAKIIHCFKNPIDACFSLFKQHFGDGHAFCYEMSEIIRYQKFYYKMMDHWLKLLGDDLFQLPYEAFIDNPDKIGQSLFKFCDLEWDKDYLNSFTKRKSVRTASVVQVREGLFKTALMRWKHYDSYMDEAKEEFKEFYDDEYNYLPEWKPGLLRRRETKTPIIRIDSNSFPF